MGPMNTNHHTTMGQREILEQLADNAKFATAIRIRFDLLDPDQFDQAYRIAMSMPARYRTEEYYQPTYEQISVAYQARDARRMGSALTCLCLDILYR